MSGDSASIREMRQKIIATPTDGLYWVDFCDAAQQSKVYAEYERRLAATPCMRLEYLGIALCGPARPVTRLTGSIGLLR